MTLLSVQSVNTTGPRRRIRWIAHLGIGWPIRRPAAAENRTLTRH